MTRLMYIVSLFFALAVIGCEAQAPRTETSVTNDKSVKLAAPSMEHLEPMVSIVLNISDMPMPMHKIQLEYYQWDKFIAHKQFELRADQPLLIPLSEPYPIGLYRLSSVDIPSARPLYFVVNGHDSKLEINTSFKDLLDGLAKIEPEDEVFVMTEIRNLFGYHVSVEDSLKDVIGKVTIIDPKYYTRKDALREQVERNRLQMYKQLDLLMSEFPETYFNQTVTRLLRKPSRYETDSLLANYETEAAMLNRHYFEGIDIDSKLWLGHPILFQTVNDFITQYAGELPAEWVTSINYLMAHLSDPEVKRLVADYLVFYYLDRQEEKVAEQIAFSHIEGCTDEYFASLKNSDRYQSGPDQNTQVPDFESYDADGKAYRVSKLVKDASLTLLYFWKSDCPFCKEEHPTIKRLNDLYADDGLQIVGISLDTDPGKWTQSIVENQLTWLNLSDLRGTASQPVKDYAIRATPSTFIVANNGRLLAKNLTGKNLTDFFKEYYNR